MDPEHGGEDESGASQSARVSLGDPEEFLYRQVTLPLREGRPSWEAFKGRKDEGWQASVDRGSIRGGPVEAYDVYANNGDRSNGVLTITVGDLLEMEVESYECKLLQNPAHCQYDLATLRTGLAVSHGMREKICTHLFERAMAEDRPRHLPSS